MFGSTKYMVSDHISMADIALISFVLIKVYNSEFEHCHILQAVVDQYPKSKAYFEKMLNEFSYWTISCNNRFK